MTIHIKTFNTQQEFLGYLKTSLEIPKTLKIVDTQHGIIERDNAAAVKWAYFLAVDVELYEKFDSIDQAESCPQIKVKLKNYGGEDISDYLNKEISLTDCDVAFVTDKFQQPTGFALVTELKNIEEVFDV